MSEAQQAIAGVGAAIPVTLQSGEADITYRFRKAADSDVVRAPVELKLKVPSIGDLHALLSPELADVAELKKVRAAVQDAVTGIVVAYVKSKVDDDLDFDQEKLEGMDAEVNLFTIANLPTNKRNVISKDDLEAFAKAFMDFAADNEEVVGFNAKTAANIAGIFVQRLKPVAGNEAMMARIQQRLNVFVEHAPEALVADHSSTISYLADRINDALGAKIDLDDI